MIISLFYYLKVVRAVFMEKNEQPVEKVQVSNTEKLALVLCGAAIVLLGLLSWVYDYIESFSR